LSDLCDTPCIDVLKKRVNPTFILRLFAAFDRVASSTGLLLKTTGLKVTAIKIDPYMNIDAGTMRPTEHGKSIGTNLSKEVAINVL
jgi:hypothetical protein